MEKEYAYIWHGFGLRDIHNDEVSKKGNIHFPLKGSVASETLIG